MIKRRVVCIWTRTGRKGDLGPCSEPSSFLATWNPYSISVLLLIASATWTPRDHLRFLNLHKHMFDPCSETTFFWMVYLSLMAQYPALDQVTGWKLPLKRSWSCTKVSKVDVLEIKTDSETGLKGVWSPCSECVLLPWLFITALKVYFLVQRKFKLIEINRSYFPLSQRPRLKKIKCMNKPLDQHHGCSCSHMHTLKPASGNQNQPTQDRTTCCTVCKRNNVTNCWSSRTPQAPVAESMNFLFFFFRNFFFPLIHFSNYCAEDVDSKDMQDQVRAETRDSAEEQFGKGVLTTSFCSCMWIGWRKFEWLGFRSRWMKWKGVWKNLEVMKGK